MYDTANNSKRNVICRICKVLAGCEDPAGAGRIKVFFNGVDGGSNIDDLPWCFPLMPKLVHVYPKAGESVIVFMEQEGSEKDNRFYIGPIISQPYYNEYDPFSSTALSALVDAHLPLKPNSTTNSDANGTLPNNEDIGLIGRKNADVVLKENQVVIRCGHQKNPDVVSPVTKRLDYNYEDPAYIQMIYKRNQNDPNARGMNKEFSSALNLCADRINIMSRDGITECDYTYPGKLVSEDLLTDPNFGFLANGHKAIYGDKLVEFLKKFIEIFNTHVHPFPKCPPSLSGAATDALSENLDDMLVDYLRMS